MNLIKIFLSGVLLLLMFTMSGCQGNNSDTPTTENNSSSNASSNIKNIQSDITSLALNINSGQDTILDLKQKQSVIVVDNTPVAISITAFDKKGLLAKYGNVNVIYPHDANNKPITYLGTITPDSVNIFQKGVANFTYNPPKNINDLKNLGKNGINFTFVSNENNDVNTTLTIKYDPEIPKIIVDDGNLTITTNGEVATINLTLYNKNNSLYDGGGNVKIKYPDSVLSGDNMGSFNLSSVPVIDGKAQFIYTAPNPLNKNKSTIFTFYHDSQPILSEKDFNITFAPVANQIVLTNYTLNTVYNTSMALDTTEGMTFYIKDENGHKIADSNVTSITATVLNSALGSLEDTAGNKGTTLTVKNKNSVQMNIKSKTLSGLIPIKIYANFKDANNDDQNLTKVINVVVLSGPPTAMSLSYASTSQNSEYAKFVENWVLTVTDKYNNLVNTHPAISVGAIIGYAESSASTKNVAHYLYYDANASDGNLSNSNPATFKSAYNAFDNVDITNDKLALFGGNGYKFNAFGKWDINAIDSANNLELSDDYNETNITGLGYAVGHNFRNETCSGSPVVANVYAKDGNNILGSNGSIIIQMEYDYYLVGKSVVLWTNLVGENNNTAVQIGLGKKVTLRGNGLSGDSYSFVKGYKGVVRLPVTINNTVEYYKNANFDYAVEISGDGNTFKVIGTSMDQNITSCVDGDGNDSDGIAYVDINITDSNSSGTIQLTNVLPSKEF